MFTGARKCTVCFFFFRNVDFSKFLSEITFCISTEYWDAWMGLQLFFCSHTFRCLWDLRLCWERWLRTQGFVLAHYFFLTYVYVVIFRNNGWMKLQLTLRSLTYILESKWGSTLIIMYWCWIFIVWEWVCIFFFKYSVKNVFTQLHRLKKSMGISCICTSNIFKKWGWKCIALITLKTRVFWSSNFSLVSHRTCREPEMWTTASRAKGLQADFCYHAL